MHELSIAYQLVETAAEAAKNAGARNVKQVFLRLGPLSGVVKGALLFSYDIATQGTLLEGSTLVVRELPVVIYCHSPSCQKEVELPSIQSFRCPICNQPSGDVRQGRELEIESLEIEVDEGMGEKV